MATELRTLFSPHVNNVTGHFPLMLIMIYFGGNTVGTAMVSLFPQVIDIIQIQYGNRFPHFSLYPPMLSLALCLLPLNDLFASRERSVALVFYLISNLNYANCTEQT